MAFISILLVAAGIATSQQSSLVKLKGGAATVTGSVTGKTYVDYRVLVGAGQKVSISLASRSSSVNFNFNPPKADVSMFIGPNGSNKLVDRMVPIEGEHIIRVYQMGAAASENKKNSYTVKVRVTGRSLKPLAGTVDAKFPGTPYHARGPVECKISLDPKRTSCDGYVIRRSHGSATVEFRFGTSIRRVLFLNGKPVAHDSPFAFSSSRKGDETTLSFGDGPDEVFTVPDAFVFGG